MAIPTNQYISGTVAGQPLQPRETPLLEGHAKRLESHAQDIDLQATRLHALADRLLGAVPVGAEKSGAGAPPPDSSVWKLNAGHEWTEAARTRLRSAIDRLEVL